MNNKYLIIVDMQNDFIGGSLGTKEAQDILPAVVERIRRAKATGRHIVVTMDTHDDYYLSTQEGMKLPVKHCIEDTDGYCLHPDVFAVIADYPVVYYHKGTFGSIEMAEELRWTVGNGILHPQSTDEFEIIGLCTDICVISNALILKAMMPEAKISVNASCCAGTTPEMHKAALDVMRSCQIDVIEEMG